MDEIEKKWPQELLPGKVCPRACECCTRHGTLIPLPETFKLLQTQEEYEQQYGQEENSWSTLVHYTFKILQIQGECEKEYGQG